MDTGAEVVVAGVGMVTAVGLSAAETLAAVHSATMRFARIDWLDRQFEPFTVAVVRDDALPELSDEPGEVQSVSTRDIRLLRLGTKALEDCLQPIAARGVRPPLFLALAEVERQRPVEPSRLLKLFAAQAGQRFDVTRSVTISLGRAGGLVALGRAVTAVRGGAQFAIAGGIDSYVDLYTLATLDIEKRVKSASHLDGFIPGEGAAFLLLASRPNAAAAGLPMLAGLSEVAEGFEKGHLGTKEPYRGEGLATAVQALIHATRSSRSFVKVWSSMNGESHWSKEWGVAFLRSRSAFAEPLAMTHPADCFGDTGAAAGAILVGLSSLERCPGPALVYASSDHGHRASVSITNSAAA